jgi:hypothetical protein
MTASGLVLSGQRLIARRIEIEHHGVAHDCGVVINPMPVEGQIVTSP